MPHPEVVPNDFLSLFQICLNRYLAEDPLNQVGTIQTVETVGSKHAFLL
jgi:hypothetical protein